MRKQIVFPSCVGLRYEGLHTQNCPYVKTLTSSARANNDFSKALLEAVDEGLLGMGESVRHVIYYHIEKNHDVKRREIPQRLKDFHEGLKVLLGVGATVPERLIARKLYDKLSLNFKDKVRWTLVDYVNHAKSAP